jgi:hypothetical protein
MDPNKTFVADEQHIYAGWLDIGMKIGFVLLLSSFVVYLSGITTPHIPVTELPLYWSMPVNEYLQAANGHRGWSWLSLAGKGDFMNFVGIVFLSAVTIACFLRITPILFRNGDKVYGVIAVIEVLVLALAASGILVVGH